MNASAFFTAISSLVSAVLVFLLVWDRLEDSLTKELRYVHKNFLFKLYSMFRDPTVSGNPNLLWYEGYQERVHKLKLDLNEYARFLGLLKLYPKDLIKNIDEYLDSHSEFLNRYTKIEETHKNQFPNIDYFRWFMEFSDYHPRGITPEEETKWKQTAQNITEENPQLVSEAQAYSQKTRKLVTIIFNELEVFLKRNKLGIE
jgi:hypothetical protein